MQPIDLRSDTVTRPTPAMRDAIARAVVGDDVYGEDPTVNRLQEVAAARVGKEVALFVPSGTMANQLAIRSQTRHGDVVLAAAGAHVLVYEAGAAAALSGVQIHTLGGPGFFDGDDLARAIPPRDVHCAPATLVALENTHNRSGGRVLALEQMNHVAVAARRHGLRLHLDGARLFNAAVALGVSPAAIASPFDTVSFCLSKGLGAPAGSMLCGDLETITRAHRLRKMLGGGMRQAGFLAAAGLFALEHHVDRLAEDHVHAQRLARGLREMGATIDPEPETNIVVFGVGTKAAAGMVRAARERGVLLGALDETRLRAVTHLDLDARAVDDAIERLRGLPGLGA